MHENLLRMRIMMSASNFANLKSNSKVGNVEVRKFEVGNFEMLNFEVDNFEV